MNLVFRRKVTFLMGFFIELVWFVWSAPAVQPAQWVPEGPGGGGALFAPSFSPYSPGEMYLACDMSEVFHSTNYGAAWSVVDFRQIEGGRQAIVQFTSDPNVRYAIDYSNDAMTPTRSVDGGATWQQLPGDPTGGGAYALYADPGSTNRLLVSDYGDVYFSNDGGNSFELKFTYSPEDSGCFVAGAFFDGTNVYVGTGPGLLVSTNNGDSFALSPAGGIDTNNEAMFSFAGAKQNGTTRFFCTTLHPGDVYPGMLIEEVYSSYLSVYTLDWGQPNWSPATTGISGQDDPVFVAMAQNDISTAYIAGQQNDDYAYPALYKTANGGATWQLSLLVTNNQNVFTGWEGSHGDSDWGYGAGALGLAVAPNDSSKAAYSDLGFVHLSTNGGAFWKQAYVNPADQNPTNAPTPKGRNYSGIGLEPTSCWSVAWGDSNHIVAGYTDIKGAISADGGRSWSFGYSGDGYNTMYCCIKNPTTGILYAGTSSVHDMYQSTHLTDASIGNSGGAVLFSTNMGVTWQTMTNFACPVIWVELDPVNTNRLFASVIATNVSRAGIYVSTSIQNGAGASWQHLAAPPRTQGHPFNIHALKDGTLVCTYSGRRAGSPQEFTASSGVFVSTNAGSSWIDRSDLNMEYWTMDLVVDPNDTAQNRWYAGVYSGWGGPPNGLGGLYKTTNRGLAWTRLNNDEGVSSCAFNPLNSNELYATTETEGLLFSSNINSASPTLTQVTSYPFGQPERIFFNPYTPSEMWVTSFGNGIRAGSTQPLPGTLQITAQSGTAQLNLLQASPGAVYSILESTNLTDWTSLGTNAAGRNGALQFNDTTATNSHRFYKSQAF
ncbi:MAG: hypothetical protein ABSG59_01825 [Verrucomicrobiota bacterium]|jgi:photosystem II stability/assembly factor-like uncharacterized protein